MEITKFEFNPSLEALLLLGAVHQQGKIITCVSDQSLTTKIMQVFWQVW